MWVGVLGGVFRLSEAHGGGFGGVDQLCGVRCTRTVSVACFNMIKRCLPGTAWRHARWINESLEMWSRGG